MGDDLDFAALLASHLCHELAGPVGVIVNGLEVLADAESNSTLRTDVMELLGEGAASALARLQFFRVAYGLSTGLGAEVSLADTAVLAEQYFAKGRVRLAWTPPLIMVSKDLSRLVLNLLLVAGETLPRGGTLSVSLEQDVQLCVIAKGTHIRFSDLQAGALAGTTRVADLEPRAASAWLAGALARTRGGSVVVDAGPDQISLTVQLG